MKNKIIIALLLSAILVNKTMAEENITDYKPSVGWQFYNLPVEKEPKGKKSPESTVPLTTLSPSEQLKLIQEKLIEARDTAIMNPTVTNIAIYKVYQDYFVEKSSKFSAKWEEMLLQYPDLDYNIKNSFYNATTPIKEATARAEEKKAIEYVNQQYGIFFFYRGHNPIDNKLAEIVKAFGKQYNLSIIPITVDGRLSPDFPQSKHDNGQSAKMGIKHFPALFLVNPKNEEYKPLSYGFITQDDLARRVLNIVTNFKPRI